VHDIYDSLNNPYDIIICTEVLEHLEYPEESLKNMLLSLNNGGKLIISVPDGRKDTFFGHINFWSPESFKIFVGETISNKQHCKYETKFYYMCGKNISVIKRIK
jgi:2-polyprenyl-3-methyl-5-hydroxy-6-metoxy-1,4-benzoquinol methylase